LANPPTGRRTGVLEDGKQAQLEGPFSCPPVATAARSRIAACAGSPRGRDPRGRRQPGAGSSIVAAVVPVEQEPRVLVLGHHRGGRAHALVRPRLEDKRCVQPSRCGIEDDHLPATAGVHAASHRRARAARSGRASPRYYGPYCPRPPDRRACRRGRRPLLPCKECAGRLAGALELERLGLALGDERPEGGESGHGVPH